MATRKKKPAKSARKAPKVGTSARSTRSAKTAKPARAAKATAAARGGARAAAARQTSADMDFVMNAFKNLPTGTARVTFRIADAGPQQSARMGVALFELVRPGEIKPVTSKEVDNLPTTPAGSTFDFVPNAGSDYVITFSGEMHSLSIANVPLTLELAVEAEGSGATIEDFGGPRSVAQRACSFVGRALLKASP